MGFILSMQNIKPENSEFRVLSTLVKGMGRSMNFCLCVSFRHANNLKERFHATTLLLRNYRFLRKAQTGFERNLCSKRLFILINGGMSEGRSMPGRSIPI